MLQRYLTEKLAHYCRDFFQDFDEDCMEISLWKGHIVLNELRLKSLALDYLIKKIGDDQSGDMEELNQCALKIEYGRIGKLELHIPWKMLRTVFYTSTLGTSPPVGGPKQVDDDHLNQLHDSCSALLSDVHVLFTTVKDSKDQDLQHTSSSSYTDAEVKKRRQLNKEKRVLELIKRLITHKTFDALFSYAKDPTVATTNGTSDPSRQTWFRTFIQNMLFHTTIRIQNVDIRYEDAGDSFGYFYLNKGESGKHANRQPQSPFAFGVAMKSLTIQSTDEKTASMEDLVELPNFQNSMSMQNHDTLYHDGSQRQHIAISVRDLAVYGDDRIMSDTTIPMFKSRTVDERFVEAEYEYFFKNSDSVCLFKREYILEPLTLSVSLNSAAIINSLNRDNRDQGYNNTDVSPASSPRIQLIVLCPTFQLNISPMTLRHATYLYQSFSLFQTLKRNECARKVYVDILKKRPKMGPLRDPTGWWSYAIAMVIVCNRSGNRKWKSWRGIIEYLRLKRKYVSLHKTLLLTPNLSHSEKEDISNHLFEIEKTLSSEQIACLRFSSLEEFLHGVVFNSMENDLQSKVDSMDDRYREALYNLNEESDLISCDYRDRYFYELSQIIHVHMLSRNKNLFTGRRDEPNTSFSRSIESNCDEDYLKLDVSILVQNFTVNVCRSGMFAPISGKLLPLLQLSSALVLTAKIRSCGSKELGVTLAATEIKQFEFKCNVNHDAIFSVESSNVLCHSGHQWVKLSSEFPVRKDIIHIPVRILNRSYHHTASLSIHWNGIASAKKKVELLFVRLSPMDISFSAKTMDVFSETFRTLHSVDSCCNLHQIMHRRRPLKRRAVVDVLQRGKNVVVDIDIHSPILLLRDELSYGTLLIDLGRMTLVNARIMTGQISSSSLLEESRCLDLMMLDSQVICTSNAKNDIETSSPEIMNLFDHGFYLIEPFSMNLKTTTILSSNSLIGRPSENSISIQMNVSPLYLNLLTSSLRLLYRLQMQVMKNDRTPIERMDSNVVTDYPAVIFEVLIPNFSARFSNDVDNRCLCFPTEPTNVMLQKNNDLVQFTMTTIHVLTEYHCLETENVVVDATIGCLNLKDLHQDIGHDFSMLLSTTGGENILKQTNILRIKFSNMTEDEPHHNADVNVIHQWFFSFPDLWIEWNPETIASWQKAIRLSQHEKNYFSQSSIRDNKSTLLLYNFYSEDIFYEMPEHQITSDADVSLFIDARRSVEDIIESERGALNHGHTVIHDTSGSMYPTQKSSIVLMNFSKVCINFNKDARRRRLAIAELNEVRLHHLTKPGGGFRTSVDMIDFSLSDPYYVHGATLYREIIGLNTENRNTSSTLHLGFESFPRPSTKGTAEPYPHLDSEKLKIEGCDTLLSLRFSPMRFVYLQQLWMEIIDYFFEGVIGYEVFGKERPKSPPSGTDTRNLDLIRDEMRFLRFEIEIDNPSIIVPAMYRSPNFFLIRCDNVHVSNHFDCKMDVVSVKSSAFPYTQFYNNCKVVFSGLTLSSWCGTQLTFDYIDNNLCHRPGMVLDVRWPIGTHAIKITPKWGVCLNLEPVSLCLRPSDYSLFSNIIQHNIGELSRFQNEWVTLMNLSHVNRQKYLDQLIVSFSYDKKDTPSTTYSFTISTSSIRIVLSNQHSSMIMDLDCSRLSWNLRKSPDRLVLQTLSVGFMSITRDTANGNSHDNSEMLLQHSAQDSAIPVDSLQLLYSSRTRPNGDNVRCLEVRDSSIFLVLPTWIRAKQFFQSLPKIEVLKPEDVLNSMQVGDRWYKIERNPNLGDSMTAHSPLATTQDLSGVSYPSPEYQFRILILRTALILTPSVSSIRASDSSLFSDSCGAIVLNLMSFDYLSMTTAAPVGVSKVCCLDGIEIFSRKGPSYILGKDQLILERSHVGLEWSSKPVSDVLESRMILFTDNLIIQASHSDLISITETSLKILCDFNSVYESEASSKLDSDIHTVKAQRRIQSIDVNCRTLSITLFDDSMRHFSCLQRLIELRCCGIHYSTSNVWDSSLQDSWTKNIRIAQIEIVDHLQNAQSPFHVVFSTDCKDHDIGRDHTLRIFQGDERMDYVAHASWKSSPMIQSLDWGYTPSRSLMDCCRIAEAERNHQVIAVDVSFNRRDIGDIFSFNIHMIVIQWNPSLVVAVQSFLGRTKKRIMATLAVHSVNDRTEMKSMNMEQGDIPTGTLTKPLSVELFFGNLTVCLNKEHQNRRLLQLTIKSTLVHSHRNHLGQVSVTGGIDNIFAWDTNQYSHNLIQPSPKNRLVLSVNCHNGIAELRQKFVTFEYLKNADTSSRSYQLDDRSCVIPDWIRQYLTSEDEKIDDCLSVRLASVKLNYIRERTAEIVDYLSNGLPGKGMGATSRAAQGFISKRIHTRSFLDLSIDSPEVSVPVNSENEGGVVLYLGDFRLKSWFDEADGDSSVVLADEQLRKLNCDSQNRPSRHDMIRQRNNTLRGDDAPLNDLWRVLSLTISRLGWHTDLDLEDTSAVRLDSRSSVNVHVVARKPLWHSRCMIIRGSSSSIESVLKYKEYALLRDVLRGNVAAPLDMNGWDNIEKAYEENAYKSSYEDLYDSSLAGSIDSPDVNNDPIQYVQHAKVVRYGVSSRTNEIESNDLEGSVREGDCKVNVDFRIFGMKLYLHRDDPSETYGTDVPVEDLNYDILLLYVSHVTIAFRSMISGEQYLSLTLDKLGLFDLGDNGRLLRESKNARMKHRRPCAFHVLAEGYSAPSGRSADNACFLNDTHDNPHLQLTLNISPVRQKSVLAQLFINRLNINPLDRPIREAVDFFVCAWSNKYNGEIAIVDNRKQAQVKAMPSMGSFELNIIAHYPTIFFLADETDPLTRALVLRGRAVIKMKNEIKTMGEEYTSSSDPCAVHNLKTIKAHLQSMESYISPQAACVLEETSCMQDILSSNFFDVSSNPLVIGQVENEATSNLGVALMEPVTVLLELEQIQRELFPVLRNLSLYVDPVSLSLSFEDLCLIDRIRRRLTCNQQLDESRRMHEDSSFDPVFLSKNNEIQETTRLFDPDPSSRSDLYEVQFSTAKLGMILRKQAEKVIVDRIDDSCFHDSALCEGDELLSINQELVSGMPFQSILDLLTTAPRPIKVIFRRQLINPELLSHSTLRRKGDEELPPLQSFSYETSSIDSMILSPLNSQSVSRFTIFLKLGKSTGLRLVQSICGNMAVVDGCNIVEFKQAINGNVRIPRIGAVIVGINDSIDVTFAETVEGIRRFEQHIDNGTGQCFFSIIFLEAPSVYWGSVDDLSIEIVRLHVSLIDDIKGRDMPLLRGKLESVSLSLQRGLGIETSLIRPRTNFLIQKDGDPLGSHSLNFSEDLVMKGRLETAFALDYYNSRISIWEPLLEDSLTIKLFFERQRGSRARSLPGNVSIVLTHSSSDKLDSYLCMNLTDAAVDILTAAVYELKRWMTDSYDFSTKDQDSDFSDRTDDLSVNAENQMRSSDGYEAQRVAADAALIFARRHGSKLVSNESTKPFILRNRTGLSIRFFRTTQNDPDLRQESDGSNKLNQVHLETNEVPNGEEARFSMDVTAAYDLLSLRANKRMRGAEPFPFLNVTLISPSSSLTIETLRDLPVMKTGTTVKRLIIHQCDIPDRMGVLTSNVVWSVDIESNRRVITISSAISISSSMGLPIELGFRIRHDSSLVRPLGIATSDIPYFLPLTLDLAFDSVEILIRPKTTLSAQNFEWSTESILSYSESDSIWKWVIPSGLTKVCCNRTLGAAHISIQPLQDHIDQLPHEKAINTGTKGRLGVMLDSFLSIRNALPVGIEWEISGCEKIIPSSLSLSDFSLDQSKLGRNNLRSGECVDILAYDTTASDTVVARFRSSNTPWSSWTSIPIRMDGFDETLSDDDSQETIIIRAENKAGLDWTLGLKRSFRSRQGIDLTVYSELWIGNFTNLPLIFGAPKSQLVPSSGEANAGPSAAESALLEISSILEFGDKGKGIVKEHDESIGESVIYELGHQLSDEAIDEVFEYIEVSQSLVKRRWWAGEIYDDIRNSPSKIDTSIDGDDWIWDDDWMIDCSGECSFVLGGWESCSTLVGSPSKYFSTKRSFDAIHPFRRRRWYRRRVRCGRVKSIMVDGVPILFHQPRTYDNNAGSAGKALKDVERSFIGGRDGVQSLEYEFHKLFVKIPDGTWSSPIEIPHIHSTTDGIIRVPGSRWPQMPARKQKRDDINPTGFPASVPAGQPKSLFNYAPLNPRCYELNYHVSTLERPWGESTKFLSVFPRFTIRNGSKTLTFEVKQSGSLDSSAIVIGVSEVRPFYWTDVNLPDLICVRPSKRSHDDSEPGDALFHRSYKWSGGFDIRTVGLFPLRVREEQRTTDLVSDKYGPSIKVLRASVEIREGSGGTGLIITLTEEKNNGEGALFRIENFSPFPIWVAQDGVLANPFSDSVSEDYRIIADDLFTNARDKRKGDSIINGDVVLPSDARCFGLDIPYRQGKYSWRDAATIDELSRVRISLAPLSTRDGIETTKVIKLSSIGEVARLSPSKLRMSLDEEQLTQLLEVKVLGLVLADGPTKVLKFCLIRKEVTVRRVLENSLRARVFTTATSSRYPDDLISRLKIAASHAISLLNNNEIPDQDIASSQMLQMLSVPQHQSQNDVKDEKVVEHISFETSLTGILLSIVDSVPSEIAVLSAKNIHIAAKWTSDLTTDSTAVITVGSAQIDNCCPNSPFPVSLHPIDRSKVDDDNFEETSVGDELTPFLSLGVIFAPKTDSVIKVLKCLNFESKDIALAVDLAFIIRLQRFLSGLFDHISRHEGQHPRSYIGTESREPWHTPSLSRIVNGYIGRSDGTAPSQSIYFQTLNVMPYTVKLSVAPSNALSYAQSIMEGEEAAAIHAAVRKGDVQLGGDSSGGIGVKIGGKNRTPLAVIHGVFKSILVDGLLRCDGASLTFPGIFLENYMSTPTQLKMYFLAHYLTAMKNNLPTLIGSLAAFGNPVGLIRGLGDGVTDFVREPVKGLQKSVKEMDPSYIMDGVAKGTESLARHTFGGIVDSASLITDTFSKNMAVLTLDRKYAQRRDQFKINPGTSTTFVGGVESGMEKLIHGVVEGVTGIVRAPIRGAEKKGVEGFAKGVGKGLLGLVVKPVIGLSDAATDVMIGVKGTLESTNKSASKSIIRFPVRPRRVFYTKDRVLRSFNAADATALALMMRTRLAGEHFLSHYDMGERVALCSVQKLLVLGPDGKEQHIIKFKHIKSVDFRPLSKPDTDITEWGVFIFLLHAGPDGVDYQVIRCETREMASEMTSQIKMGVQLLNRGF